MKNKSFLSNFEKLKANIPVHLHTERKLLPRLKFMGYVLYIWCIAALVFAILYSKDSEQSAGLVQENFGNANAAGLSLENDEDLLELNPTEVLNFYAVSFIFALVGTTCFLIAWKKRKTLFHK